MLAYSRALACTPARAIDPKALDVARLSEMMELQPSSDERECRCLAVIMQPLHPSQADLHIPLLP